MRTKSICQGEKEGNGCKKIAGQIECRAQNLDRFNTCKDVLTHSLYVPYAAEDFPCRVIVEDLRREETKTSFR
jgi:DNA-binding FrmR family transcriptional regulator